MSLALLRISLGAFSSRETNALVLLINGHGELAEDFVADVPGVSESRKCNRGLREFVAA
jgi:hypothetical protein